MNRTALVLVAGLALIPSADATEPFDGWDPGRSADSPFDRAARGGWRWREYRVPEPRPRSASNVALATRFPISGDYGDEAGCQLLAGIGTGVVGGVGGNFSGGLVITPSELIGLEWTCRPVAIHREIDDEVATLECSGEGGAWTSTARLKVDDNAVSITIDDWAPISLQGCRP